MIQVDIWSDINCPFCYIGKRHLEEALKTFTRRDEVQIRWRSFELDPEANPPKGADNVDLLAKKYGKDRSWAIEMNQNMTQMAARAGLEFHMENVVPANSFNAHRLIHLAAESGAQDAMKEKLLDAKFVRGLDINDQETLSLLAQEIGLKNELVDELWSSEKFSKEVRTDEVEASRLGIRGVPFFVFNSEIGLSGAQPVSVFTEVLEKLK